MKRIKLFEELNNDNDKSFNELIELMEMGMTYTDSCEKIGVSRNFKQKLSLKQTRMIDEIDALGISDETSRNYYGASKDWNDYHNISIKPKTKKEEPIIKPKKLSPIDKLKDEIDELKKTKYSNRWEILDLLKKSISLNYLDGVKELLSFCDESITDSLMALSLRIDNKDIINTLLKYGKLHLGTKTLHELLISNNYNLLQEIMRYCKTYGIVSVSPILIDDLFNSENGDMILYFLKEYTRYFDFTNSNRYPCEFYLLLLKRTLTEQNTKMLDILLNKWHRYGGNLSDFYYKEYSPSKKLLLSYVDNTSDEIKEIINEYLKNVQTMIDNHNKKSFNEKQ